MRTSESGALSCKVSVVIPCYNSSAYLRETVESVLAQSLRDMEVVLVDDGGDPSSLEWIERLIARSGDRRLRLVCQAHSGVAAARNRGISEARGAYILPVDADDLIDRAMLQECSELLDADPALALVYTDRQDFGDVERVWAAGRFELQRLKYFNQIAYCSMYRKSAWEDIGGYRVNVSGFDDWDFWVACAARGFQARHLAKPLLKHRRHGNSYLWQILPEYERLYAQIILNNREAYSAAEAEIARRYLSNGEASAMLSSSRFVFLGGYRDGYMA